LSAARLEAARQRLAEALRRGEDTGPHRAAIHWLEEDARAAAGKAAEAQQAAQEKAAQAQRAAIETRAAELANQARQEVAAAVADFQEKTRHE
jgi:hypothetical protein